MPGGRKPGHGFETCLQSKPDGWNMVIFQAKSLDQREIQFILITSMFQLFGVYYVRSWSSVCFKINALRARAGRFSVVLFKASAIQALYFSEHVRLPGNVAGPTGTSDLGLPASAVEQHSAQTALSSIQRASRAISQNAAAAGTHSYESSPTKSDFGQLDPQHAQMNCRA